MRVLVKSFSAAILILASTSALAQTPLAVATSPVRLNQLGFDVDGAKRAVVPNPSTSPLAWSLMDSAGAETASGKTQVFGDDAPSGEHLHLVDVSGFSRPGDGYVLTVGAARSRPFSISPHPFRRLKLSALNYFYQTRSGVPIEARYVSRPDLARPAGHLPDKATCYDKADQNGAVWPGCAYTLDATGGWYDAGDQGKYVVNGGIAAWTLLNYYERSQLGGSARSPEAFSDGRVAIPENHNGVNDLLDEARWEVTFLLEMQVPQGVHMRLPVGAFSKGQKLTFTDVDTSGMAHHKLTDAHWTPLPTPPQDDHETRYLYPPSTAATLNLAATAAQCARIWRTIDSAFSARCLTASKRAFDAAQRNPQIYAVGDFTGGGGYGDPKVTDELYWAACELFVTTGDERYRKVMAQSPYYLTAPTPGPGGSGDISWGETAALGTISLATVPNHLAPAEVAKARVNLVSAADGYLAQAKRVGYDIPYAPPGYPWGSNGDVLNHAMVLGLAYDFTGQRRYRDGATDALDYILGRNPLDQSYVAGYGARPLLNPHHRFWAHELDASLPYAPPGVLSGGPNSTSLGDPVAAKLKGNCHPQTCWADDIRAYTVNEEAINWNAPLFWVASFLDEGGG